MEPNAQSNAQSSNTTSDAPWLNIPKATYQPRNDNDPDVEQQAGLNAPNPASQKHGPNGGQQNSVRTRVFSGLLMLTVIALVVIILVVTSGLRVKSSKVKHH